MNYYQDDLVTLYHGDCLTEHREWLDADVLVTDPPYGMSYTSRSGVSVAGDKTVEVRDDALQKWGDEKPALIFGTWRQSRPAETRSLLVWWKDNCPVGSGDTKLPFGPSHEEIYVMGQEWSNPKRRTHPRPRSHKAGSSGPAHRSGSVFRTAINLTGGNGMAAQIGHPTPKPVSLMEELIGWCPPGVIADPFAGSGSTLVAAVNQGRRAIGVELEERYCELIAKRLANQTATLDFGGDV